MITKLWQEAGLGLEDIEMTSPPEGRGDFSSNVAMKLAGRLKKSPLETAEEIKKALEVTPTPPQSPPQAVGEEKFFEKIEIARPGFLNFFVKAGEFKKVVGEVEKLGDEFGKSKAGAGKTVMVEFGQPNTHKAITVGHLRSAVSGLSVAKLFEAVGHKVVRANFFGDVGMHVAKSTWGFLQRELPEGFESWSSAEKMKFIDEGYVEASRVFEEDEKVQAEIRRINNDIYAKTYNENYRAYQKIRAWSIQHQDEVFASLGIKYDRQYPESEVFEDAVKIVKKYEGTIFQKSEGAVIFDGEKEGLNTSVFLTGEGNPTYAAKDLGLADKKFSEFDLDLGIVTTSVEQTDHFKTVIFVLEKIYPQLKGRYKHVPFGWLLMGNKKTSSRKGKTVKCVDVLVEAKQLATEKISIDKEYDEETKQEIIEKVALAGLKFLILSHEFHKNINYDPEQFIKLNGFSGPFILYSYVRTQAILRKLGKPSGFEEIDVENVLNSKEELDLLRLLDLFGDVVENSAREIAPHLVCNYVYEVAQKFNAFYEKCSIKDASSENGKNARLRLVRATGQVLKNGMDLLGIETVEKM